MYPLLKKLLFQPELFILLLGNAICVWYFLDHQQGFDNIIWIYWFQSVVIGIFNFLEILSMQRFSAKGFTLNDEPITAKNKGCAAWFFLLHYGIFHVAYFVFIAVKFNSSLNSKVIMLAVAAFFLESLITFRRRLSLEKVTEINLGSVFMLPYLRVIPMHLTILLPSFFNWHPSLLFLLLKTFADILFFLIAQRVYRQSPAKQQ